MRLRGGAGQHRAARRALRIAHIDEGQHRRQRGSRDAQRSSRTPARHQVRTDRIDARLREIAADTDWRLAGKQTDLLAIGAEGQVQPLVAERKPAPADHDILFRVDEDRVRRRYAIAHGEGDQPAIDLHRFFELILKHLRDEGADVDFGQLHIARPHRAGGQDRGNAAIGAAKRIMQRVPDAGHLNPPLDRAVGARFRHAPSRQQRAHGRGGQANVIIRMRRPLPRVDPDVRRDMPARHIECQGG